MTGLNLDRATVRRLATEVDSVRYIKDSSADWEQALRLIHHHSDVIGTFIGWNSYLYSALVEGAAGVVAGTANVVSSEIVAVRRLIGAGDLAGALVKWKALYPVIDALLSEPFIPAVKAALALQGEPVGAPRLHRRVRRRGGEQHPQGPGGAGAERVTLRRWASHGVVGDAADGLLDRRAAG